MPASTAPPPAAREVTAPVVVWSSRAARPAGQPAPDAGSRDAPAPPAPVIAHGSAGLDVFRNWRRPEDAPAANHALRDYQLALQAVEDANVRRARAATPRVAEDDGDAAWRDLDDDDEPDAPARGPLAVRGFELALEEVQSSLAWEMNEQELDRARAAMPRMEQTQETAAQPADAPATWSFQPPSLDPTTQPPNPGYCPLPCCGHPPTGPLRPGTPRTGCAGPSSSAPRTPIAGEHQAETRADERRRYAELLPAADRLRDLAADLLRLAADDAAGADAERAAARAARARDLDGQLRELGRRIAAAAALVRRSAESLHREAREAAGASGGPARPGWELLGDARADEGLGRQLEQVPNEEGASVSTSVAATVATSPYADLPPFGFVLVPGPAADRGRF